MQIGMRNGENKGEGRKIEKDGERRMVKCILGKDDHSHELETHMHKYKIKKKTLEILHITKTSLGMI